METFVYYPQNVCSRRMTIAYDGYKIVSVEVEGGCQGNSQGLCSLVKDMDMREVVKRIEGIKCRGSRGNASSCPDQLASALKKILSL